jgi:thiamine-monophosphate kinase
MVRRDRSMRDGIALGPGAEFDLIRRLRDRWGALAPRIGDDAAVLRVGRGEQLVASTDAALEGVHFRREWLTAEEIGYRAVTAALSDLAAMGATPIGVLVSLQLPPPALTEVDRLADGIGDAVRSVGTIILGGNMARGNSLGITTTVLGSVYTPLTRAGARPGDLLYVTGSLGGPGSAVRALLAGSTPSPAQRARFARPVARLAEARWLAARGAVAAIDISDGLAGDAKHLASASDVSVQIQVERLPLVEGATADDALGGGEEFELLVAARAPLPAAEFASQFGVPLTLIGRVVAGVPDAVFSRGATRVASPVSYDHFSR